MKFLEYKIKEGDTLESIAKEYNITVKELVDFHNKNCGITQQIIGDFIPIHISEIIISILSQEQILEREKTDTTKSNIIRYRCEQINTSKINDSLSHFVHQHFQYIFNTEINGRYFVKLEDYHFEANPTFLTPSLKFISRTEFIKHNVQFKISSDTGRVSEIINKKNILENWKKFKENDFYNDEFIQELEKTNTHAVSELKKMGDTQFAIDYKLYEEEYRRNLFYFIMFDKILIEEFQDIQNENFDFLSTIIPPIIIPIEFRYDKISEENNILKFRKVGKANLNEKLVSEIRQKYDEIHKPNIKFNFTEYKLEFRVRGEFNLETNEMENADLFIIEQIADNIENQCEYHLKKLKNYTS